MIPELYYFIWYLDGIAVQKVDVHMCVVVLVHILGIRFNTIWIFLELFLDFTKKLLVIGLCIHKTGSQQFLEISAPLRWSLLIRYLLYM